MIGLLETIRIEQRRPQALEYHSRRLNASRSAVYGAVKPIDLTRAVVVPADVDASLYKCRVVCGVEIHKIEFHRYTPRPVHSLRIVEARTFDYRHKYAERTQLERLRDRRGEADEILIAIDGCITDTSYSNVAFFDGTAWWTPDRPLLRGTMRQRLIDDGVIRSTRIRVNDIWAYRSISLINSMLDLGQVVVPTEAVE